MKFGYAFKVPKARKGAAKFVWTKTEFLRNASEKAMKDLGYKTRKLKRK